ncbi:MAG: hypothetical protein R3266_01555 [Gemmatimonadota bacterium]|nr:hypothetical protein [Gemmatimonadota bacterium]
MRRPTLTETAQIAEVVAAVAVVISLVYVGRELRSNTAAVRAASVQEVANLSAEILLTTAADSALARLRQIGDRDPSRLGEADRYRYATLIRQAWLTMQNAYFQNELDVIDPRVWEGYGRIVCAMWSNPGIRATWPAHRGVLDSGFVAFVEAC